MSKKKDLERLKASFGSIKDDGYNFELIDKYFRKKDHTGAFQVLSDKTCNDLDFDELFMFLDRTHSRVGQQYLFNRLRTIPASGCLLELQEKIIALMSENVDFRIHTQRQLESLKKDDAYYISSLFQEEQIKPPKWFFVIRLFFFTTVLSLILLPFNSNMLFVLLGVSMVNIGIHYWNKNNLYQYLGSIPQLLKLNRLAQKLFQEKTFQEINPNLPQSIRVINQVKRRMSFFQLEGKLQGEMEAIVWTILEIVKMLFLLEPLLLFGILRRIDIKRKEIEEVFSFVGQIDMLLSVASLRAGLDEHCSPLITENETAISAAHIYHPLIVDCVPNAITVSDKSILLTGSNMSGKTSFIRTIGVNAITGLTINTCFAQSIVIPRMRIYSAIRISDDLLNDKSYYFEEVLTIKELLEKSADDKTNLFLLDEIFKGTNTLERISAGKAVLSALAKKQNRVFVSTHDIELTDLLADEFELYHFSEIVTGQNVDFDYKLKEGKLQNSNAIQILKINDYPEHVIDEAIEIRTRLASS